MEIQKREELIELYDLYYELLTDKQRDYFEEYYYMDLSITEIAINHEISRNGVYDQLKRVCNILYDYESKMKLNEKIKAIEKLNLDENTLNQVLNILKGVDE